jgi:prepilin peptidase CpaA
LALIATGFDLFNKREIPNTIPALMLLWSILATAAGWQTHGWLSLAAGLGAGLCIGVVLFTFAGFGGGDAKLIASLGAVMGLAAEFSMLFYMAIGGAILGFIALLRRQKEFAYSPAIAAAVLVVTLRGAV